MAGTLLLHIGIDLMLEGLVDSLGKFDHLEYAGIWLITIVMTVWGMSAALIAGIITALSTYAVQSITHLNPIRSIITASTLRSSSWERTAEDLIILDDERMGRNKILAIQLQGHVSVLEGVQFSGPSTTHFDYLRPGSSFRKCCIDGGRNQRGIE